MQAYLHLSVCDGLLGQYPSPVTFLFSLSFSHVCPWCCDVWLAPEIEATLLLAHILVRFGFWSTSTDQVYCIVGCYLSLEVQECPVWHYNRFTASISSAWCDESFSWSYAEWSCATLLRFCTCWIRIHLQQFTRKQRIWCTVCLAWSTAECFFSLKQLYWCVSLRRFSKSSCLTPWALNGGLHESVSITWKCWAR